MATTNLSAINAALGPSIRGTDYDFNRYVYTKFLDGVPLLQEVDGTAAVVTDAGINIAQIGGHTFMFQVEQAFGGTAPQLLDRAGGGLRLIVDSADNDGIGFGLPWCTSAGQGTLRTAGKGIFTVGTDEMFVKVGLVVTDVSEADEVAVGFLRVQLIDADLAGVSTDYCVLNVDNGTVKTLTRLNSGAAGSTSTTQTVADAGAITLEVRVGLNGVAKTLINGVAPTVEVSNFTFDAADLIMPFVKVLSDAAGAVGVILTSWESGTFGERGLINISDLSN